LDTSAEEFLPLLIQTRLFDAQSAAAALARWRESAGEGAIDAAQWRRWLVEQNLLTEYQSSLLGRGHTEGFFLGDYKILDRVGRGRMAGVYGAIDAAGMVVAIKVLPPSKAKDPILLARFRREARITQRLAHLNVVGARAVGEISGFNYLVMDYLDGETLDAILTRREKLGLQESIDLVEQALCGLQHIYEMGLVHRDLKPGNMMILPRLLTGESDVTTGRILKILDFGLSRVADEDPDEEPLQDTHLTAAGAMLGTPDYVAPEQARDASAADIRADIYSLGCVAYHMLTGRPPFPDKNAIRQMVRHATETPPPLKHARPEAPVFVQKFLDRMLAKAPGDRFATPLQALLTLRDGSSRETESLVAAQAPQGPIASPGSIVALSDLHSEEFGFSGADAPTIRQQVYLPSAEVAAAKPADSSTTRSELDNATTTSDRDAPMEVAPSASPRPKRRAKTLESQRSMIRETKDQVAMPEPAPEPMQTASSWKMNRRDAVMFAAGATTVLLALSLGAFFSWITRAH
jgi:serine/threonine protein kinase